MGLTQDEFGEKIGVSPATVSLYESGERKPRLEALEKIAKVIKVSLAALLDIQVKEADLDIALRSEKLTLDEVKEVRKYVKLLRNARVHGEATK